MQVTHEVTEAKDVRPIEVTTGKKFPRWRWKEAILQYLNDVLSERKGVIGHEQITFPVVYGKTGSVTLYRGDRGYRADYASLNEEVPHWYPWRPRGIEVGSGYPEAEWGLARFVKSSQVESLTINLDPVRKSRFTLQKTGKGHLWISFQNLDRTP